MNWKQKNEKNMQIHLHSHHRRQSQQQQHPRTVGVSKQARVRDDGPQLHDQMTGM